MMKFRSDADVVTRPLVVEDAPAALALYSEFGNGPPCTDNAAFERVLNHPGTTVWGAFASEALLGMATLHVMPNVTWGARPYALIENVITHSGYRRQGVGRRVMDATTSAAFDAGAYKIMLLTGTKRSAVEFYRKVGFDTEDKTGLVLRRP